MKGFKRSGMWPFNSDLSTDADFQGASVIDHFIEDEGETRYILGTSSPSTSNVTGLNFVEANLSSVLIVSSLQNILPYSKAGKRKLSCRQKER